MKMFHSIKLDNIPSNKMKSNNNPYSKMTKLNKTLSTIWRYRALYIMMLPGIIYYIIFKYGPMYGILIAFKDYQFLKGIWGSPWANPWYKHFLYFYKTPYFKELIVNTLLISIYKLFWGMPSSIILALLLNEVKNKTFKRITQTITYMPHFLSWVIIYGITFALLSETYGIVNEWIKNIFDKTIPFMTSTKWFRTILVATEVWKDTGWGAIIYLAAIAGIDPTIFESSKLDGASKVQMMFYITIPSISNVIVLLLILRLGNILNAGFDQIFIMSNPMVLPVADIIDTWVFRTGIYDLNFSLSTAVGLFKSVIAMVLIVTVNKIARKWGEALW